MPPWWKHSEPKKHEPLKPGSASPTQHNQTPVQHSQEQHGAEPVKPLPGRMPKQRGVREMQLEAFELDGQAHGLSREYIELLAKHGSEEKVPREVLQEIHKRADILRARQEALRKEYEEKA